MLGSGDVFARMVELGSSLMFVTRIDASTNSEY